MHLAACLQADYPEPIEAHENAIHDSAFILSQLLQDKQEPSKVNFRIHRASFTSFGYCHRTCVVTISISAFCKEIPIFIPALCVTSTKELTQKFTKSLPGPSRDQRQESKIISRDIMDTV